MANCFRRFYLKNICASVFGGSIVTTLYIYLTLSWATLLSYYCQTECDLNMWSYPIPPEDRLIISHLRNHVIDSPQKEVEEPLTKDDLEGRYWKMIDQWHLLQKVIQNTFPMVWNGTFVEVGASDGVFLSFTSWLEKERNWSGLLIEPRPSAYRDLRRRRKAASAQVCVSDVAFHRQNYFWLPKNTENMLGEYRKIAEGKSTLLRYVGEADRELGKVTKVPCFTLDALLLAAGIGRRERIDLLVIHTMGGEDVILECLDYRDILMLLIHDRGGTSKESIFLDAVRLNMKPYGNVPKNIDNFAIFINKNVDLIQESPRNSME